MGRVADAARLPPVLGFIVAGFCSRPITDSITASAAPYIQTLAFLVVLVRAGLEIELTDLNRVTVPLGLLPVLADGSAIMATAIESGVLCSRPWLRSGAAYFLLLALLRQRGALVHTAAPLYFSAPMGLDCARHARRLLEETAAHKRSLVRYGAYALSDVVALLRYRPLGAAAQAELMPGVYSLIGMCTQVELQELHANSDPVGKRILADLLEGYQTSHKYRG
ncbi:hypothetical protein EMIHUDRAFT_241657 [Emiliania huxleyi CCMP1516]|uniref:Nucleolar 27S pre-rRNA processing Urb2/Npa2 C-terminal domain-containing protein n=2 Tax=Emiliania huxleyi TaxID=2903 RepID=A0A0D3JC70_EMIH1|nr:hypothetical protein EMIHUDRAFT_241657 [Emiliania huxleyi CCMP1516]EOD21105.1 hypothetical protein EMIHUDRAFT_241657 [Emiliania huxleyi CCMP1516]|eukprot:XP_005773534.1 hypothetical protein EMIHUDRAFT_241657 [Emiliania huxleyi CCMP1516]